MMRRRPGSQRRKSEGEVRTFGVKLPESQRWAGEPIEDQADFVAHWKDTHHTPQMLLRMQLTQEMMAQMDRAGDVDEMIAMERNVPPGSLQWASLTTGFPRAAPSPEGVPACPRCKKELTDVGRIATSPDAGVHLLVCCVSGVAIWRHQPPTEGPYVVGQLAVLPVGPRVTFLLTNPVWTAPLPRWLWVMFQGRLVGQLTVLRRNLLFTNYLGLALTPVPPMPLAEDELTVVREAVVACGKAILQGVQNPPW